MSDSHPYSEECYKFADSLQEANDTFETVIDWLSQDTDLGDREQDVYEDHQKVYNHADNFRSTMYRMLDRNDINSLPNHLAMVEKELVRADKLVGEYDEIS